MGVESKALEEVAGVCASTYLQSAEAQEHIAKAVKTTVNHAINSALGTYSNFGQDIEAAVKKCLVIHGEIDLPSYNDLLLNLITAQVEAATKDVIEKQVADRVKELLTPAPESIRLSDLIKEYIQYLKNQESDGCVCYGERHRITFEVSKERDGLFQTIYLDPESGKKTNECEIHIGIFKDSIYYIRFRDSDIERRMFVGPLYGFQRALFQMKAAKTKLILDHEEEEIELDYGSDHED